MTESNARVDRFFERYGAALLARDEAAIAGMWAIPSLVLSPDQSIPVGDAKQVEEFFASSWGQYEGIHSIDKAIEIMAEAPGIVWADVTWSSGGQARERYCYQLVDSGDGFRLAVLTPMSVE